MPKLHFILFKQIKIMKNLFIFSIITYLLCTINSGAVNQNLNNDNLENENILKVGVLLPLTGKYQKIGESFLKAIQLALYDISNQNIKIYPKDSKGNALGAYQSSKEFEELGIEIVIGPIFRVHVKEISRKQSFKKVIRRIYKIKIC